MSCRAARTACRSRRRWRRWRTCPVCAAVASTASPFGFPRRSHTAMVTRGVLRMRLTFHDFSWVIATRRSPSGAAQIGVGLGLPSLVNVVSRMYSALATSAKVAGMAPNVAAGSALQVALGLQEHLAQAVERRRLGLGPHAAVGGLEQPLGHAVQRPRVGLGQELAVLLVEHVAPR